MRWIIRRDIFFCELITKLKNMKITLRISWRISSGREDFSRLFLFEVTSMKLPHRSKSLFSEIFETEGNAWYRKRLLEDLSLPKFFRSLTEVLWKSLANKMSSKKFLWRTNFTVPVRCNLLEAISDHWISLDTSVKSQTSRCWKFQTHSRGNRRLDLVASDHRLSLRDYQLISLVIFDW